MRLLPLVMMLGVIHSAAAQAAPDPEPHAVGEQEALYRCSRSTGQVVVTLKPETEVKDLLAWVMSFTCKNFVLDPRVTTTGKKVTIIAPSKVTAAQAYRLFLIALSTVKLTIVAKDEQTYRVVEAPTAKGDTVPIYKNGIPDNVEQIVRYVYRPAYMQADALQRALLTLKTDAGDLQLVGSVLLITDYASQVRDMMSIAKLIDVPNGTEGVYTLPVLHADATKLAPKLEAFLGVNPGTTATKAPAGTPTGDAAAVPSRIMVDERTNTLVVASSQAGYERLKALVERLDIELASDGGASFHVYKLGNALADEMAQTLNSAISGRAPVAKAGPGVAPATASATAPSSLGAALEGQVHVIGDKPTNSLLVVASGRDFLALRGVIRDLDQPRRQVYLEAMVLEVNVADSLDLGVSGHAGIPTSNGSVVVGGVQAPNLRSYDLKSALSGSGLIGGLVGPTSKALLGQSIPSYALLFQALGTASNTKILINTGTIAVDNGEAKFKSGTSIPYQKGLSIGNVTSTDALPGSLTTNIDRKDLDFELNIKPHISDGELVYLEIKHSAADLGDSVGNLGPSWNTRLLETSAVVRDQQTIVLGGIMQEREIKTTSKVPLLGDIPLLGYLFKYTSTTKKKSNLVILLTPYIIKDQLDLQSLRERKLREHDEFLGSYANLEHRAFVPAMDYRRKRGLIEEINRTLVEVDQDTESRQRVERDRKTVTSGPLGDAAAAP